MELFRRLSNDMSENLSEARDKIKTAYSVKESCPEAGQWYCEMANAHVNFNANGMQVIKRRIEEYKSTDEYKNRPVYADGMLEAWNAVLSGLTARSAEIKAMIDTYK